MLVVHRAASTAVLATALAEVMRTPLADPFAREVVAVPTKGVERWLAQRLSHVLGAADGDGVCAAVDFPFPGDLVDDVVQAACPEAGEAVARWSPRRAMWSLVDVIDECVDEAWCGTLRRHVFEPGDSAADGREKGEDRGRRLRVAARLARLFDAYAQARPEMLRAWVDGRTGADTQGGGLLVPDDLAWQPELWRRLRAHLGVPSPAELVEHACARLRDGADVPDLAPRLSVFGATHLSAARLAVLAALAERREVHLWLHHPSPALWRTATDAPVVQPRREDRTRARVKNPLLASLGRDLLELQELLQRVCPSIGNVQHSSAPPAELGSATLLGRLQASLADDDLPAAAPLERSDRSVQVHACHGRTRQVEVLREVVLGLLAADPTLEPRDVLVMCPDVETFAPLLAAAFGEVDERGGEHGLVHPASRLRVRIADRSARQTNPLLAVLADLLDLATGRMTATQVLDLATRPVVRRRFGFDDEDVERVRDWVAGTGVRWGFDGPHRAEWQLRGVTQGTWREGLDRLLVGAVTADPLDGLVPLDDIDSADIDLAGRFAELLDRLAAGQELLAGRHPAAVWCTRLEQVVLSLGAAASDASWQELQLRGALADLMEDAGTSGAVFGVNDLRAALEPVLAPRPTRSSFRTGGLTVCTLVPMRSVPHRVVCLLGLDDGVFPRQTVRDGDDLLGRDPWVGERDPRSEDRQLLLDAIGSATQHLVITYTGADERTGVAVPPAVPLGELLDALDRTATIDGGRVRDAIVVRHPLQPFDPQCFRSDALGVPGPFSFDPLAFRAATVARPVPAIPGTRAPFLSHPLPPAAPRDLELADLVRLLERPARGFLRQRLEVGVVSNEEEPADTLPLELDALQDWQVGDRLLRDRLAGLTPQECKARELRRGVLPPGALGDRTATRLGRAVEEIVAASGTERVPDPEAVDVDIRLRDGTRVIGTVGGVRGEVLLYTGFFRVGPRQRLRAWVELLALTVAHPDRKLRAVLVGRGSGRDAGAVRKMLGPLAADDARERLEELVSLYRAGLRAPLPAPTKTAATYAEQRFRGNSPVGALRLAERAWLSDRRYRGEQEEPEHALLYGERAPLSVVVAERPWAAEAGPGWPSDEESRFAVVARRMWTPLLEAEGRALT